MKLTQNQWKVLDYIAERGYAGRQLNLSYAMTAVTLARRGLVDYTHGKKGVGKVYFVTSAGRTALLDRNMERFGGV